MSWQGDLAKRYYSEPTFEGPSSSPLNSYSSPRPAQTLPSASGPPSRSVIEKVDINDLFSQVSTAVGGGAMGALEFAGRVPGFTYERPIALAGAVAKKATGFDVVDFLGKIPGVELAGDVVHNVQNFVPAIINMDFGNNLKGLSRIVTDNPGDARLQEFFQGELDEARKRGFSDEDIKGILGGTKNTWDFGDRAVSSNPLLDMGARIVGDPLNLMLGLGLVSKAAKGVGLLSKTTRLGAELEKPLAIADAASAVARGAAKEVTWPGVAEFIGSLGRGARTVGKGYALTAAGTTAAQAGLLATEKLGLTNPFLEDLYEANRAIMDYRPMSNDSAFALISAYNFPFHTAFRATKAVGGKVVGAIIPKSGSYVNDIKPQVVRAFASTMPELKGKSVGQQLQAIEAKYGSGVVDETTYQAMGSIVLKGDSRSPGMPKTLQEAISKAGSFTEDVASRSSHNAIIEREIIRRLQAGEFNGRQIVDWMKERHAFRRGPNDKPLNRVAFKWDGDQYLANWREFSATVAPLGKTYRDRLAALGIDSRDPLPIIGLAETASKEDLDRVAYMWKKVATKDGMVPFKEYSDILSSHPALLHEGGEYFQRHLAAQQPVSIRKLTSKLANMKESAPSQAELFHESAAAEGATWTKPTDPPPSHIQASARMERDIQNAYDSGNVALGQDLNRQLGVANGGTVESGGAIRAQAQILAEKDAQYTQELPVTRLHRSLTDVTDQLKQEISPYEAYLRSKGSPYTMQAAPNMAWLYEQGAGKPILSALRDREALLFHLWYDTKLNGLVRFIDGLTAPVTAHGLSEATRQHIYTELAPSGVKPEQVDRWLQALAARAKEIRILPYGPERPVTLFKPQGLPTAFINDAAEKIFGANVTKTFGRRFDQVLDRGMNRLIRNIEADIRAGKSGHLAEAIDSTYRNWQGSKPGAVSRFVGKTFYQIFRFVLDPRWHLMNYLEADILAGTRDGLRATRFMGAQRAKPSTAEEIHTGRTGKQIAALEADFGDGGYHLTRHDEGYISRMFDIERPETTLDTIRNHPQVQAIRQMFPGKADADIVQEIDDWLYSLDSKGVAATVDANLQHFGTKEFFEANPEATALVQQIYRRNDELYRDLTRTLRGNPDRSTLERLLNSYWLYWPISYQMKAGRWLVDVMTRRALGRQTNLTGAALYNELLKRHKDGLTNDEEYRRIFEESPTPFFIAQMLMPITPGDLGVSLSRLPRYSVSWLREQTGGDESPLSWWGDYKAAKDPVSMAAAAMNIGLSYTVDLLQRAQGELAGVRRFEIEVPVAEEAPAIRYTP